METERSVGRTAGREMMDANMDKTPFGLGILLTTHNWGIVARPASVGKYP
jgi:hypothetical protein